MTNLPEKVFTAKDKWETTALFIDLTESEAVWLRRTLAKYTESDHAFGIRCKLSDSMRVNKMGIDDEKYTDHPATTGVEEYASEGRAYYKKAALAQTAIGVGSILQSVATWVIAAILAVAFLSGCTVVPKRSDVARPAVDRPIPARPAAPSRIDAAEVIKSADDSGCDLGAVIYSEGQRDSKIGIFCRGGIQVPNPNQF